MPEICRYCNIKDDENHRLNKCRVLEDINWANKDEKVNFNDIYSDNDTTKTQIIKNIERIWEFRHANGKMIKK